ncbi:MAG: hypothetical protein RSA62_03595 [Oscillospiraceae bacterium]
MAQVLLNETDGRIKELYGEYQAPIASIIMERDEQLKKNSIARKIFAERPSTHSIEGYGATTAIDSFAPVGENGQYPSGGFESGYFNALRNVTWKGSFGISMEAQEDISIMDMKRAPAGFFSDYERKFEGFFAALLGNAIQGKTEFSVKGQTFSTKTADGVCLFSKSHAPKVTGTNQSNIFSNALSAEALFAIMTEMQNLKDDNNNTMNICPDTIIIPNVASLKLALLQIVGTNRAPGTANNDFNPLFENFNIITWQRLNDFVSPGTSPYVLMDSHYNEIVDCAIFQNRKELTLRDEIAANDAYKWYGNARFTGGFVDFRSMVVGGVTGGTAA